jgi:hypothetical protein
MIEKSGGFYSLTCDICYEEADEQFFEFSEAVDYKKDNDWKSKKVNGEWMDVCPDCQD